VSGGGGGSGDSSAESSLRDRLDRDHIFSTLLSLLSPLSRKSWVSTWLYKVVTSNSPSATMLRMMAEGTGFTTRIPLKE